MRTRDGIPIRYIEKIAISLGIGTRAGNKHSTVLTYPRMRPCPVADSTNARTMVVPWMREATEHQYASNELYRALKRGRPSE